MILLLRQARPIAHRPCCILVLLLREGCDLRDILLVLPRHRIRSVPLDIVHRARRHRAIEHAAIAEVGDRLAHRVLQRRADAPFHILLIRGRDHAVGEAFQHPIRRARCAESCTPCPIELSVRRLRRLSNVSSRTS